MSVPSGDAVLFDKTAADLQEAVAVSGGVVTGTLSEVADWSSAGFDPEKGTHYLALHMEALKDGQALVVEAVPSQGTPTPEFTDDDVVVQLTEDSTGVKVTVIDDGEAVHSETLGLRLEML